jgi:transposase
MDYGAIDLHKRRSQVRLVDAMGAVILERRIDTTREALTQLWGGRPRARVLVESSTESEWVAQCLQGLGHEVIVADPNYAPMYGHRSRAVKTDKRDVAALAEACRVGVYRAAHRASAEGRALRGALRVRRQLVRQRSGLISLLRALLRQEGVRLGSGAAEGVVGRLERVSIPAALAAAVTPLRTMLAQLTATLTAMDTQLQAEAAQNPVAQHLMSAPGVGPVVALTFQAVLDDPGRFGGDAARASAFLGLVPREYSSGDRRQRGAISKAGPPELRALLVQASWTIWRGRRGAGAALRAWVTALAARRGRRVAIVALARRLSRVLYALWRDRVDFVEPMRRVAA